MNSYVTVRKLEEERTRKKAKWCSKATKTYINFMKYSLLNRTKNIPTCWIAKPF